MIAIKEAAVELLIVRHAQPVRASGGDVPADPSLTERGRGQAAALAEWVVGDGDELPAKIVSSPMRRALETAAAIGELSGVPVATDERLAEFDRGAKEYIPLEQLGHDVFASAATALLTGVWGSHRFDPDEFRGRVWSAFDGIVSAPEPGRVVVVCHGGVLNSYLSRVVGREYGAFFLPRYTSVSRVFVDQEGGLRLGSLNELPHASVRDGLTF